MEEVPSKNQRTFLNDNGQNTKKHRQKADGSRFHKTGNNLNLKAKKLEFGDNRTPPLGVFRSSIANHKTEWAKAFVETARMAIKGKCQTQESLEQLGKQVVFDLENECLNLANRTKKLNPELAKELSEVADALSYQTRTKS